MAFHWRQIVGYILIGLAAADAVFLLCIAVISYLTPEVKPPEGSMVMGETAIAIGSYTGTLLSWAFPLFLFLLGRFLVRYTPDPF